jgi:N-carbamoyl-L-amino-acid hydrolase
MAGRPNLVEIDGPRFWSTIERSGEIGPGAKGGLKRMALTDADKAMRDEFVGWLRQAGSAVSVDGVGNIFGRRKGREDHLPPVVIGSHLDTTYAGGRYDGIVGVLAGLEILRTLDDRGIETRRPVEVVSWSNEEGTRFTPAMSASGAFAGVYTPDFVLGLKDDDGHVFGEELARIGYRGAVPVGGRALDSYFELHIEQGPILDGEGTKLGIVVGGYTSFGCLIDVHGENAHTGPTPMAKRKNALFGASLLVNAVHEIGWSRADTDGKGNASRLLCRPNKFGIIPDYAQVTLDVRHESPAEARAMFAELEAAIPQAAARANVRMDVVSRWSFGDERFDADCIARVKGAADALGIAWREIKSQAGHDAYYVSRVAPTCLLFSPCTDGITHNEAEHTTLADTAPAVNAMLNAVLDRANR